MESTVFDPRKLIPSFIYTWIMCGGRERGKERKKRFLLCKTNRWTDEVVWCLGSLYFVFVQSLPGIPMIIELLDIIHRGLHSILHTFWHQSSELYIFLILVNLYKYTPELLTGKCHSPIFYPRSLFYSVDLVPAIMHVI